MGLLERAKIRIEYGVFRLVAALAAALPLEVASSLSGRLWRLIAPRLSRHRRALDNLALAFPDMSLAERQRVALAMWDNLGRTFAEFVHMKQIMAEQRVTLEPLDKFEAVAKGPPFIVCTLHLGNWELASQAALHFGLPLAGVYQKLTNPLVNRWTYEQRRSAYPGGLFDKSPATSRALVKLVKSGGYAAFVADLREGRGIQVPFFGRPARSNPFPAALARMTGMPLYAVCVTRTKGAHFVMSIEPVAVPTSGDRDADVLAATAALQARFEAFVRQAPEQWMWAHRRWD
ncbi:MAG: lauroyl acyltransferase [Bradyrhizobium sp.]|nr:MAG: lauroyl acyltransferase [Bradyrhizobium sp.]